VAEENAGDQGFWFQGNPRKPSRNPSRDRLRGFNGKGGVNTTPPFHKGFTEDLKCRACIYSKETK